MRMGQSQDGTASDGNAGARLVALVMLGLVGIGGCASEPKEPPPRSVNEIRSDSDRFFDKVKQEERERGAGPAGPASPAP